MRGLRRALVLTTGERYFSLIANFITLSIVSRLLTPDEIGVSVLGGAIAGTAMAFREFATPTFIIQRVNLSKDDVRTVATIQVMASIAIGTAIACGGSFIANVYGDARLASFLHVVGLAVAAECIGTTIAALLRREMAFVKLASINVVGALVCSATMLFLTWHGFSYMSFAWTWLVSSLLNGVLSLLVWRDTSIFMPSIKSWRAVTRFCGMSGGNVMLSRLYDAIPYLVLGRIWTMETVALYNRALTVCQLPDKAFFGGFASALLPAFSAHARDGGDLRVSYLRSVEFITAFQWPALAVTSILANPIVRIVLGDQWLSAVPVVQIIALACVFNFADQLLYPTLVAAGAMRDVLRRALIVWPISGAIIIFAAHFGVYAAAFAWFICAPFQAVVSNCFIRRHIPFEWRDLLKILHKATILIFGAAAGPLAVISLHQGNFDLSFQATALSVALSAVGWLLTLRIVQHPLLQEIRIISRAILSTVFTGQSARTPMSGLLGGQKSN
jgi:O-antigen/teichoic acid export membrane protein